ncbi:MAG: TerC family protein [Dehalococcoidia bacterium]|nr:TerC family protein [Dehalococcoidia bacterium]
MSDQVMLWIGFNVFVLGMLVLDLGVFHRKSHVIKMKEALLWTAAWICLALTFNLGVYFLGGQDAALQFLAGYLIEKSLSIDNIFVFLLIFSAFGVPALYQHKVLFWGILGALVMRALFIAAGVSLIEAFHWMVYLFGAFLIATGIKMALQKERGIHPERNPVLRLFRRFVPVTANNEGDKFLVKRGGQYLATPLLIVLLVVESTDVLFAVDSIPAILAVTSDPFIVYTSNVFAILGLRALYFAVAGLIGLFHYLNYGLAAVLAFVGTKMLVSDIYKIPIAVALLVIAFILLTSVLASVRWPRREAAVAPIELAQEEGTFVG